MTVALAVPTVAVMLAEAEARLAAAGVDTPRADAEWLLAGMLDVGRNALALNAMRPLPAATAERYAVALERRARREPLQRILGWEEFRGLRMRLTPEVLIPRPETELLVEWAIEMIAESSGERPSAGCASRVVDVGTGSGCIACAIAHARADVAVLALDVSPAAASVARANVEALGLERRVRVALGDLTTALAAESADMIVANLPYLPSAWLDDLAPEVSAHDPRLALDGGIDGLDAIRRLVADARRALRAGGALLLETAGDGGGDGASLAERTREAQVRAVARLLEDAGFVGVATRADLAGIPRFVAARMPATAALTPDAAAGEGAA